MLALSRCILKINTAMLRNLLLGIASIASLGAIALPATAETRIGGLDLETYCRESARSAHGITNVVGVRLSVQEEDAFTWKCHYRVKNPMYIPLFLDKETGFNTTEVCQYQHGREAYAKLGDRKDIYSWSCYKP
jgi:hypothetical protein